ncbi:peroxiredoxin [Pelagibacteraceae bacterium]|nr:peroxiredoxin [Pelagibacteraceae bacterium]
MDYSKFPRPKDDGEANHLLNSPLPAISLKNQQGSLLNLKRSDTFRLILYFYSMTGNPNKNLPQNWDQIPGATGCTSQTCTFRDNYEEFIKLNAIPIGISTQTVEDIKEMTNRLFIPYDVLSDSDYSLMNSLSIPNFTNENKIFFKRITLIVEKNIVKKVFYPIFFPNKHINEVLKWLREN